VARVLEPLLVARQQRPPMAAVYGLITDVWARASSSPTLEEFAVVIEGVQTFPRNAPLVMQAAMLASLKKFPKEALALATHGQKIARDQPERNRFELMANAFERDAAPAPAAAASAAPDPAEPKQGESYLPKLP
jgi:hypothetical protein